MYTLDEQKTEQSTGRELGQGKEPGGINLLENDRGHGHLFFKAAGGVSLY
jgi:hypothetical protein